MKDFFKEIFEYHHHYNQLLVEEIKTNFSQLPERTFPLFCHILNAHHIWNARIMLSSNTYQVHQLHQLDFCTSIDNENFDETIRLLNEVDLESTISYKTSKGEEFSNKIRDILFHVANHSTHHKGQIISQFRESGITPLITDYIFYKR